MTEGVMSADELPMSIVVVVLAGRDYLRRCLGALARQVGAPSREVIVPCDEGLEDVEGLTREFPDVQFVQIRGRHSYAELRALGFGRARGTIVALTEDHCSPEPEWCAAIMKAHGGRAAAAGGAVDKDGPDSALNWAVYLNDFSRYMNPISGGPSEYLTDCNVSYKRAALASITDVWREEFHETTVNWTLSKHGSELLLAPEIVVKQHRALRLRPALMERFAFGRLFGGMRVVSTTTPRRFMYASLSLALLVILPARVAANVLRKRRHLVEFARALPALLLLTSVWTIGEMVGYLTGSAGNIVRQEQVSRSLS